ncbi:P27 family phage terminase small subunit [Mesorhizobium yinganensis]|uniref:P27 family phage terminase small subunit n=1 Tax=Mesorhizobium yinganensis TaxID=3157707 RepID=UPI0032B70BF9
MGARGPQSAASLTVVADNPQPTPRRLAAKERAPAPKHLSKATRAWWDEVTAEYALESHHLRLLQAAGEAWDRCQQAREAIGKHGLTFTDERGAVKARPEVAIERDSRISFMRAIRELDLDGEGPGGEPTRPPAIGSNRR